MKSTEEKIIAYRIMYYYPEKVREELQDKLTISDGDYDAIEKDYYKENPETFLKDMVEVSFKHPLVQKVLKEIG